MLNLLLHYACMSRFHLVTSSSPLLHTSPLFPGSHPAALFQPAHPHPVSPCCPRISFQAAAQLLQEGFFFAAVKVVYSDLELLKATLEEMQLLVDQGAAEEKTSPEVAARTWAWRELDKELFLTQVCEALAWATSVPSIS